MKIVSNKREWPEALAYFASVESELRCVGWCLTGIDPRRYTITLAPVPPFDLDKLEEDADKFESRLAALTAESGG